jgi:type II secretory pathway pseudopilin PulG
MSVRTTRKLAGIVSVVALMIVGSVAGAAMAASVRNKSQRQNARVAPAHVQTAATATRTTISTHAAESGSASDEKDGTNDESSVENETGSDGPGGHQDAAGDVNHQFNGQE